MEMPPFELAVEQMASFLAQHNHPSQIRWIFREDVTTYKLTWWVRLPVKTANVEHARDRYEQGIRRGLGVNLHAQCAIDNISYCYVWVPEDETDAEYAMVSGLKLSITDPLPRGRVAPGGWRWRVRCLSNHLRGWDRLARDVPSLVERL